MTKGQLIKRMGEACIRLHMAKEHYRACYTRMMRKSPGVDGRLRGTPLQEERKDASRQALEVEREALEEIRGLLFIMRHKGWTVEGAPNFPKVQP